MTLIRYLVPGVPGTSCMFYPDNGQVSSVLQCL